MGTAVLNPGANKFSAGEILMAPITAAVPTLAASGGKFGPTSAWTGWQKLGGTTTGFTLSVVPTTADFMVQESFYPMHIIQTTETADATFTLAELSRAALAYVFNAGSAASVTGTGGSFATTGASGTAFAQFTPPLIGQQFRAMVGWQSEFDDEVIFLYQTLNTATVAPVRAKGPQEAALAFNCRSELPATNPDTNCGATSTMVTPFRWYMV